MNELRFQLNISRQQAMQYYQGTAKSVMVVAETGQRISFPAEHIRPFIDQAGVHGRFKIQFDNNNKMVGLSKV